MELKELKRCDCGGDPHVEFGFSCTGQPKTTISCTKCKKCVIKIGNDHYSAFAEWNNLQLAAEIRLIKEKIYKTQKGGSILDKYFDDLKEYLESALNPYDVPVHIIMEIAGFATVKANIMTFDEVQKQYKVWERQLRRMKRNG